MGWLNEEKIKGNFRRNSDGMKADPQSARQAQGAVPTKSRHAIEQQDQDREEQRRAARCRHF
jgi:hypothetical protein